MTASPARTIEGVADLDFRDADCCLAGSMREILRHLGTEVSYAHLMAVSGAAFKLLWHRGWCPSNNSMGVLGEEPLRRLFGAVGFRYELLPGGMQGGDEAEVRQRVVASIDAGRPVLAWGIVGAPDEGIVAGYVEGGRTLLGRSYFHDGSSGYYREADWWPRCAGFLLVGDAVDPASRSAALRDTVAWALDLGRTPERPHDAPDRACGLAAYEAWAAALERDGDFPAGDLETLTFRCLVSNAVTLCGLLDARRAAATFLAAEAEGDADLQAAAQAYGREVALLTEAAARAPMHFAPADERTRMADAGMRRTLAGAIRRAAREDAAALEALARYAGTPL